ncbi:MAG: hypothetical protein HQK89_06780, partial [Nitrospirae bacterium]|nr:hypothetical protein [Nitrospirota bacterium]
LFTNVLKHAFPRGSVCLNNGKCEIGIVIRSLSASISASISASMDGNIAPEVFGKKLSVANKPGRPVPSGAMVELIVRDNGVGFPEELDFRKTRTLGMHIVLTLVKQLEGTIELKRLPQPPAESVSITNFPYGKGTEFIITFRKQLIG